MIWNDRMRSGVINAKHGRGNKYDGINISSLFCMHNPAAHFDCENMLDRYSIFKWCLPTYMDFCITHGILLNVFVTLWVGERVRPGQQAEYLGQQATYTVNIYIYLLTTQQQQRLPITSTHDKECVLLVIVIITIAKPGVVRERCVNSWLHVAGDWAHALAPHSSGNQIIVCNVFNNKDHTLAGFTLRDEPCHLPTKNDTRWSCWIILNWFSFKCERPLKMRCRIVDEQINSILNQRKKPQYAVFRNCMMPPWTVVSRNFCLLCLFCGWQIFDANDVYIYVYIYINGWMSVVWRFLSCLWASSPLATSPRRAFYVMKRERETRVLLL